MGDDDTYIVLDDKGKLMPWGEFATHEDAHTAMCNGATLNINKEIEIYYIGKKSEYDKHNPKVADVFACIDIAD